MSEVSPLSLSFVERAAGTAFIVQRDGKWGFVDKSGKEISGVKYDTLSYFLYGLAKVRANNKWGFVNEAGKEVVAVKYGEVKDLTFGRTRVELDNKFGVFDTTGKEIIPVKYEYIDDFFWAIGRIKLNNKWGLVNEKGKEITAIKYQEIGSSNEGLWSARFNNKWGFLDSTGKELIPLIYDEIGVFVFEFDDQEGFNDGLAMVKVNDKWGVIDKTGREIIPIKYHEIRNENNYDELNYFRAKLNNEFIYFDDKGKELKRSAATSTTTTPKTGTKPNATEAKLITPPLPMKGTVDPSLVGTWKNHDDAMSSNGYFIFRANGTYDYYSDITSVLL